MASRSRTNISNGVFSGLMIFFGIAFALLVYFLFHTISLSTFDYTGLQVRTANFRGHAYLASSSLWAIGFIYMIPGVVGVVSTVLRFKWLYIIQLVLCVLTLLAMTGVFIASVILVHYYTAEYDTTGCQTIYGTCVCSTVLYSSLNYTCLDIDIIRSTAIGSVVMIVFGWLCTLAATILGGMLSFFLEDFKSSSSISKSRSKEDFKSSSSISKSRSPEVYMTNLAYDEDRYSQQEPYSRRYHSKA
ncbi:uncharacterized protein [Haliotis cracherodii]|uniref:uncharacterized protein n=1 Tax=Haliotis cracherodii TaxID=6455 RepID=UPI0039EAD76E